MSSQEKPSSFSEIFKKSAKHFRELAAQYEKDGKCELAYYAKLNAGYADQLARIGAKETRGFFV